MQEPTPTPERAEKKHVVFVLSGYGRHRRGAERMVAQLVERLSGQYDFTVLGSGTDAPAAVALPCISRDAGWTNFINRTPLIGHASRVFQLDPLNWEWLSHAWAARRWLVEHRCDLLIPEGGRWGGWLGRWYRNRTGTPFIDIAQGAPSRWERAAARCRPDCYVAPTRVSADIMADVVPGLRVAVLPMGVDTKTFSPDGDKAPLDMPRPVVLSVGALEQLKRMELVIRAVHALGRGSVVLVGDGPERAALEDVGRALLGPERFCIRQAAPVDMPGWYRAADLFVSASRSEAFGLVYLEALACGLPVVTQDDAVRREVLGGTGWLVDDPTPASWAAAMAKALNEHDPIAARRRAAQYDVAMWADRFAALIQSVLDKTTRLPE